MTARAGVGPMPQATHMAAAKIGDRQRQMCRQPVLADIDAVHQPRLDHLPAERPLGAAEQEQRQEPPPEPALDAAAQGKEQKGQKERGADEAAEKAVSPLPPDR